MPAYDANLFTPPAPLARVTLRRSGTTTAVSDVPMLLDSGADATLLPKATLGLLGIAATAGADYELVAFDGTKSVAQSVELELVFAKRAFVGRFLLIDQTWGILGRNILNHVAVLLDGPQLSWSEISR